MTSLRSVTATATAALLLAAAACGGKSPSAPTPSIPNVAGSYSGTATLDFPNQNLHLVCPATTTVTQTGALVTVTPLVLGGDCGGASLRLGQSTIDTSGSITAATSSGTAQDPSCGTYTYTGSGGFSGREFHLSITTQSTTCEPFSFNATLTR